jgi:hypothetical protein
VEAKQIANLELELPELIKLSTIPPELQSKTLIVFSKADLMEKIHLKYPAEFIAV